MFYSGDTRVLSREGCIEEYIDKRSIFVIIYVCMRNFLVLLCLAFVDGTLLKKTERPNLFLTLTYPINYLCFQLFMLHNDYMLYNFLHNSSLNGQLTFPRAEYGSQ